MTRASSFEELRRNGCPYVDKTEQIHKFFLSRKDQYVLSRPRGFGKSLLISTLKAIFEGKRELFRGLALDSIDYDWPTLPVIHLDMGSVRAENIEELEAAILKLLEANASANGVPLRNLMTIDFQFYELIKDVAETSPAGKVVLLIDDYDKPVLDHLGKDDAEDIWLRLLNFYTIVKSTGAKQWTALLTGDTKCHLSNYITGPNNLDNLTMDPRAATLLGYTRAELRENFGDQIAAYAEANGMMSEEAYAELEEWYGGYRFDHKAEAVFNPVLIGKCLANRKRKAYWAETGVPAFLVNLLRKDPMGIKETVVFDLTLIAYDPGTRALFTVLYQAGCLTIKGFEEDKDDNRFYTVGFPNRDVAESINEAILASFCNIGRGDGDDRIGKARAALRDGDVGGLLDVLRVCFGALPGDLADQKEYFYGMVFYALVQLAGGEVDSETSTGTDQIDAVLKTEKRIFFFEFKLNGTVEEAMEQIRERRYYEKYLGDGRELVLVGVAFDKETRNIGKWAVAAQPATEPDTESAEPAG